MQDTSKHTQALDEILKQNPSVAAFFPIRGVAFAMDPEHDMVFMTMDVFIRGRVTHVGSTLQMKFL